MTRKLFSKIDTWVFDLDQTLYPVEMGLFDQIEIKMTNFIVRTLKVSQSEANDLRAKYWGKYGTTLAGLMKHHAVEPEPYLREVHDISFASLEADPRLRDRIANLPGRKIVYTNGSKPYAEKVLQARGLNALFDDIFGIEHADYAPKPNIEAYRIVFRKAGLVPEKSAMFEDDCRNLKVPHSLGMRTVHVAPTSSPAPHIMHHTDDISAFLAKLS